LVFLGHPKPWHGAEALPKLLSHPALASIGARLLVVGGGPEPTLPCAAAASARGVSDRVAIAGPLPQREALARLRTGHVAVAPTRSTKTSTSVRSRPSNRSVRACPSSARAKATSTKKIVGDGGILVEPGDDDAFAQACARLLTDSRLRAETSSGSA
jgi:glycosyltransferase involved in cell wall biosynthesis